MNLTGSFKKPTAIIAITLAAHVVSLAQQPLYKDSKQSIDARVQNLLSLMTLEEKIGQMNMPCVYLDEIGSGIEGKMEGVRKFTLGTKETGIGPGGGFFTLPNNILHKGPRQQAEFHNELQKLAIENTRLGIPLLMNEEGTHGLMCSGGTIFPEGPGIATSFNMDLVKDIYSVTAREARAIGIHQLFTLVIEPNRDPRLGRNQEGYSEDPYLCSRIAEAVVAGIQGDDISAPDKTVAGLAHYPGQSEPVSGMERGAMEISERKFRDVFLPPWEAGIKKSGALAVMATYPAINGSPVHSSEKMMTKILREELGFEGLVMGEGHGITTIVYEQIAATQKEAGELALKSGLDVGISYEEGYLRPMIENVQEGIVNMSLIDQAVGRILRQKFRLGLFENPYVDPGHAIAVSHTEENQQLALKAAREGIVLLKNEMDLLPLSKNIRSIAVIGPNADDERNQLGDYISNVILQDVVTVLEGVEQKVSPNTKVTYVKGCNVLGNELNEISKAANAARKADIAIVVVGENERKAPNDQGTNGEGRDVASLDLTGMQEELVRKVAETGTPTIVVLINGRPLSTRWIAENIPVVVEAWLPGEKGGIAVADILFGDYNPDGRLPITIPRHVGQLPCYYNYMPSKEYWMKEKGYIDMPSSPLYAFGHGLSYTTFGYSNLKISPENPGTATTITVSVDVTNTGSRSGAEVVQLYIDDVISSMTTPVLELQEFRKIWLNPGETQTVTFTLEPQQLAMLDKNMDWVVEPGLFKVMIGHASDDIRLTGEFVVHEKGNGHQIGHF